MTLSWWGSAFVALLALMLAAVGFAAWCAWQTRLARDEAARARRQAERVAAWCGIPEWWVPTDRWPAQRPPRDGATLAAMRAAASAEEPTLAHVLDPDRPPFLRYRPLRADELGGGGPR